MVAMCGFKVDLWPDIRVDEKRSVRHDDQPQHVGVLIYRNRCLITTGSGCYIKREQDVRCQQGLVFDSLRGVSGFS
jgi:hypothetical protein